MAYFRNSDVNRVNLHYGIRAISIYGAGAFFFVFMLKSGVPLPLVLVSLASVLVGRFILRPSVVAFCARYGVRNVLIFGTLLNAAEFPLLGEVQGVGSALVAFCIVSAVADTYYWTTYHAYFAAVGDREHRGHQLGVREAAVAVVGIVSPLVMGWALVMFGPRVAFGTTAFIQLFSVIPLLFAPPVPIARRAPGAFKAAVPGMMLFFADGWIQAGYTTVWQIALFLALGEDFTAYGGALAIAALVGAAGSLLLGRHIDAGHGRRAVLLAFAVLGGTILFRGAVTGNATLAVTANALGALVAALYTPTLMTAVYNLAKGSPCPLRFHMATEGGWDAGGASACLITALLVTLGAPLAAGILLSLAGAFGSFFLLRRYYAG